MRHATTGVWPCLSELMCLLCVCALYARCVCARVHACVRVVRGGGPGRVGAPTLLWSPYCQRTFSTTAARLGAQCVHATWAISEMPPGRSGQALGMLGNRRQAGENFT